MHVFSKGDRVRVSSGEPKPPAHHTKKHRRWTLYNFTGYVHRVEKNGALVIDESGRGFGTTLIRPWECEVTPLPPRQ